MFSNLRFCWFIVRSVNVERDILQNNIVLLNDRLCRCRVCVSRTVKVLCSNFSDGNAIKTLLFYDINNVLFLEL
jgi:hypothetical protein